MLKSLLQELDGAFLIAKGDHSGFHCHTYSDARFDGVQPDVIAQPGQPGDGTGLAATGGRLGRQRLQLRGPARSGGLEPFAPHLDQPLEQAPMEYRDLVRRYFAALDSLGRDGPPAPAPESGEVP